MTRTQTERTLSAGELALAGDLMNEEGAGYGIDNTKWMHRLKDLELKLKAEREGRALDRNEANRRINTLEQITDQARMREAKEERRRQLERGG